jgi:hypothetical protein
MWFKADESLTENQVQTGLAYIIKDGVASQAMGILTGGAFLVAFAVKLEAPYLVIGLLAAIGPLSQLLQLPAIFLVEKVRNRRAITVFSAARSRLCWLLVALIPFLFSAKIGLVFLLFAMVFAGALGAIGGCSWNSWMRDLIPQNILGSFFSKRMRIATAVGIVLSILAAVFLDSWKKFLPGHEIHGYSILFFVGFLAGSAGLYFLSKTPEKRMLLSAEKVRIFGLLSSPFKDENFRKLIAFMCS